MTVFFARLQRWWRPEIGVFLGLWLLLLLVGRTRLFRDPGTFWHTRLGQEMLTSGHLIHGDPFSFTAPRLPGGTTWIPHQWLGEGLMALLYSVNGWDSLLLATVALLAGLYTWIAHRLIRSGMHWSLALIFVGLALAVGSNHFHIRPHLATLVCLALSFAFLQDFETGRKSLGQLFWLVPLYVLWTNLHGGMLGGLVTMGLAVAGWTGARLMRWESPLRGGRQFIALCVLLVACGLTAWINPYGNRLPATWLVIMRAPHLNEIITEHARLDPTRPEGAMALIAGAVYLGLLASVRPWKMRVTWLLPLVWLLLACSRVRHASLFGVVAVLAIGDIFPQTLWAQAIVRRGGDLFVPPDEKRRETKLGMPIIAFCFVALVSCLLSFLPSALGARTWTAFDPKIWPVALMEPLRQERDERLIFNELNMGGVLIFYAPQLRIFIDDRCELYSADDFLWNYAQAAWFAPETIEQWREEYGFRLAMTQAGSLMDGYLRNCTTGWRLIAECEAATLFRFEGPVAAQ